MIAGEKEFYFLFNHSIINIYFNLKRNTFNNAILYCASRYTIRLMKKPTTMPYIVNVNAAVCLYKRAEKLRRNILTVTGD